MDDADRAKDFEMRHRAAALKAHQQNAEPTDQPLYVNNERVCIDCGIAIPKERLKAYPIAVRCIECKEIYERREATR